MTGNSKRDRPFGRTPRSDRKAGRAAKAAAVNRPPLTDAETQALARWYLDPVRWWHDFLGDPLPDGPAWEGCRNYQVEILRSIAENRQTNVVTGHSVGKDFTLARAVLWWLSTRPNGVVLTTATTEKQVEVVLWGEIRTAYSKAKVPIGGDLAPQAASLRFGPKHYALGLTSKDSNALQGFHAEGGVLAVIDEAAGVPEWAIQAFEACATSSDSRVVKIGNPTCSADHRFARDCRMADEPGVRRTIRVSSLDTPNVVKGREVVRGLATREWVDDMAAKYGRESVLYGVRVLGKFPPASATGLIGYDVLEASRLRSVGYEPPASAVKRLGCDVARYGEDATEVYVAQGGHAWQPHGGRNIRGADGASVAKQLALLAKENGCVSIAVDVGGVGAGVIDSLYDLQARGEMSPDVEIHANDFGARATDPTQHADRRTELWHRLRDWLREGGAIDPDEILEEELLAPSYKWVGQAVRLEAKPDIKKRLGRSPDRADALALAVAGHAGKTSGAARLSVW